MRHALRTIGFRGFPASIFVVSICLIAASATLRGQDAGATADATAPPAQAVLPTAPAVDANAAPTPATSAPAASSTAPAADGTATPAQAVTPTAPAVDANAAPASAATAPVVSSTPQAADATPTPAQAVAPPSYATPPAADASAPTQTTPPAAPAANAGAAPDSSASAPPSPPAPPTPAAATNTDPSTPTGWKRYNFAADGFSASFPTDPALQKRDVPTDAWTFELRSYTAKTDSSALFVGVIDYGVTAESSEPDVLLQGIKTGFVKNVKGRLLNEKPVLLGDKHGVAFEVESDSMHFFTRIYLVGTTLYQEHVASPIKDIYPAPDLFFESFQLIPRSGTPLDSTGAAPSAASSAAPAAATATPAPSSSTDGSIPQ